MRPIKIFAVFAVLLMIVCIIPFETSEHIWNETVRLYCGTDDEKRVEQTKMRGNAVWKNGGSTYKIPKGGMSL